MKKCCKCKIEKTCNEFHSNPSATDGLASWCKLCVKGYQDKYRETDKCKNSKRKHEKTEKRIISRNRYYKTKGYLITRKKYISNKRKDPVFKLTDNFRKRTCKALKRNSKSLGTINLLGCSGSELMDYLELKFYKNMTRDNYGRVWHIDHIKPCSAFDMSKPEEQKKCFHYTNLQPLLAIDNLKKSNKREQYNGTKNFTVF